MCLLIQYGTWIGEEATSHTRIAENEQAWPECSSSAGQQRARRNPEDSAVFAGIFSLRRVSMLAQPTRVRRHPKDSAA